MVDIEYKKEYLPGYTGHVPRGRHIYGVTQGLINKIVANKQDVPTSNYDVDFQKGCQKVSFATRTLFKKPPAQDQTQSVLLYGNYSKKGDNWIGGPTHTISASHIPGYRGHVPSLNCENIYGISYSKAVANSINRQVEKGIDIPQKERFRSLSMSQFNKDNHRMLRNSIEPCDLNDSKLLEKFSDQQFTGMEVSKNNSYMEIPTIGYSGHKSAYKNSIISINHRKDPSFSYNGFRLRMKNERSHNQSFSDLGERFKRASSSVSFDNRSSPDAQIKIPISGYTGHRIGYKSQNFYGKNFRECSIQSKLIQSLMIK